MLLLIQEYSGKLSFDTAGRSVRRSVRNVFLKRDLSGKPIARKDNGIFSRRRCGNGKVVRLYRITAVKIIVPVGYRHAETAAVACNGDSQHVARLERERMAVGTAEATAVNGLFLLRLF